MLTVRRGLFLLACLGLLGWYWPELKTMVPLALTLEHGGVVGLYQSDGIFVGTEPFTLRFREDGTVDALAGAERLGPPMEYAIENGEVVIYQS